MKVILSILLLLCLSVSSQTLTYSYIDPCTGSLKTLNVPNDGITVTYYKQIKTFSKTDILNGSFETWASGVFDQYGQNSPCGTAVGLTGVVNIAQGTAINVIGLLNSLSAISDIRADQASELSGGGMLDVTSFVGGAQSSSSKKEDKKDDKGEQTPQTGNNQSQETNQNSQTPTNGITTTNNNNQAGEGATQSNSANNGSGTTQNSNSSTNSSTNVQGGNSGTTNQPTESGGGQAQSSVNPPAPQNQQANGAQNDQSNAQGDQNVPTATSKENETSTPDQSSNTTPKEETKQSNVLGGAVSSIANASGKSEGNKPTTVLSSDFTGFNFKNNDVVYGGKVTGGFTSMRWDGRRTHGVMIDYTSLTNGPNITAFYAFMHKKRIDLISVTGTASFIGKGSLYGTAAFGQMWSVKKAKVIYLMTTSWGQLFQEKFVGTAFVTGGMYDWKVAKRVDVKMMGLFIYAPFISYYNDIVLKSPYVIMPILGTNIGITKRFKFNINLGGTYAIKEDVLNFTIMCGTRFAL